MNCEKQIVENLFPVKCNYSYPIFLNDPLLLFKLIFNEVTSFYSIEKKHFFEKRRYVNVINCKHVIIYMLKVNCIASLSEVARIVGLDHHTSIMHAMKSVRNSMKGFGSLAQQEGVLHISKKFKLNYEQHIFNAGKRKKYI